MIHEKLNNLVTKFLFSDQTNPKNLSIIIIISQKEISLNRKLINNKNKREEKRQFKKGKKP